MKFKAFILLILLLCSLPAMAADSDVLREAKGIQETLNPINLALGPAIDHAISSGNDALAQRLEQLRGIIQEALLTVNKILTDTTINVNSDAEGRIRQLNAAVQSDLDLFKTMTDGTVENVDTRMSERIDQFSNNVGNLVSALPIPVQPLPNVPKNGFSLVKVRTPGASTPLFINGSGMLKGGVRPKAYVMTGDSWKDHHMFGHNGTEVPVTAASMGLIEVQIPEALFPQGSTVERTLVLVMNAGGMIFNSTVEPSYPLLLASALPKYVIKWRASTDGQYWEKRAIRHPNTDGEGHLYIDNGSDGGTAATRRLCPSDLNQGAGNWNVDPTVGHAGMDYGNWYGKVGDEHIGHVTIDGQGCIELYAARDSSGGGHAQVWGVMVHQRMLKAGQCTEVPASAPLPIDYGRETVIDTKLNDLIAACAQPSEGAAQSPRATYYIDVYDEQGQRVGHSELTPHSGRRRLGNTQVFAEITETGTLSVTATSYVGSRMELAQLQ